MPARSREAGYSLVALVAGLTIMLIFMGMAAPAWRYLMQDMREEELIFRGSQIAEAIERYQKKNANTYPPSMEVLVKGKYLRKNYKDPMVPSGKWRFLRPGEAVVAAPGGVVPGLGARPGAGPSPALPNLPGREVTGGPAASGVGPIAGVVSTSSLKGYRKFNSREKYNEWAFIAGQPRFVGDAPMPGAPQPGGPAGPQAPGRPVPPGGGGPAMPTPPPTGSDSRSQ